jgi:hypothetical protein
MIKKYGQFLLIVLLIGWAFDLLFWKLDIGVNFVLFVVLCLLGGHLILLSNGIKPARRSLWLLLPIMFFLVITFVRREQLTIFLAYLFTLLSLALYVFSYLGGRWMAFTLPDYFYEFFRLIKSIFTAPIKLGLLYRAEQQEAANKKKFPLGAVLRGLVFAVPILLIFIALLSSADVVFDQKVTNLFEDFSGEDLLENVVRLMLVGWTAFWVSGVILHAAKKSQEKPLLGEDKPFIEQKLGFVEASVILGSVVVLFSTFVIIQFQYLFGGEVNIGVEGYTYSQYARKGFSELIWVAFISLLLILGLNMLTKRQGRMEKWVYSGLCSGVVLLVLVILASAFQRLRLGIDWHGYSRLRLYPSLFLFWLGLLLIVAIILEMVKRDRYVTFAALLASFGFGATLIFFNVDASIVHHNVLRPEQGKHFNVTHLTSLSLDAVPSLVEEFQNPDLDEETHEGIGAAILCYQYSEALREYDQDEWRVFNYSSWKAGEAIGQIVEELDDYTIKLNKNPMRVHTPDGTPYNCDK